jgi:signal transduction histidine kinase
VLLVEDEGVGIPPEDVDMIFQPFRGSFGKGTGLGLAIVHRIVTDYGGQIEVKPRPGGGTMFRITFPDRADAHAERQAS